MTSETIMMCFSKAKLLLLESKDSIIKSKQAELSLEKVDMKKISFKEFLEFVCRLAFAAYSFDQKSASKAKSASLKRLVQMSQQPLPVQLAVFLDVFIK